MKRFYFSVFAMMIMALVCAGFASCGGDDDDEGGNSNGSSFVGNWYVRPIEGINNNVCTELKKNLIDKINRNLSENPQLQKNDFFDYNGALIDPKYPNWSPGGGSYASFVHIIDKNTLSINDWGLYAYAIGSSGSTGQDLVAIINTGTIVGEVGAYSKPTYYTYERIDNKVYVTMAGTIFTISGTNLLEDGGGVYTIFTPGQKY